MADTTPTRNAARILVVDDEPMIGTLVDVVLARAHGTTRCKDVSEALALIRSGERFDLILCDLNMPGASGIDLYEALLVCAPEQARRVVVITGGATTIRTAELRRSTRLRRLAKPFTPPEPRAVAADALDELGAPGERSSASQSHWRWTLAPEASAPRALCPPAGTLLRTARVDQLELGQRLVDLRALLPQLRHLRADLAHHVFELLAAPSPCGP